jgi:hypothetical protein
MWYLVIDMNPLRIGIDFDGVIANHHPQKARLVQALGLELEEWQLNSNVLREFLSEEAYRILQREIYGEMTLEAPPLADALEVIARLPGEPYIISARRPENESYPRLWMKRHHLDEVIPFERVIFCEEGRGKRAHCERLGISVFLDDKLSYLTHLPTELQRVLFDVDGIAPRLTLPRDILVTASWKDFEKRISE